LQDEIEMFAMHPLPLTTQGTYHHLYEVNTNAIREISNRHLIILCAKKWIGVDDVNLSIPWWRNFSRWQNSILQSLSNLPPICLLCWKLSVVVHQIGLLLRFFGQASRFASQLWGVVLSFAKGTHLRTSHKTKLSPQIESSRSLLALATLMGQVAYRHDTSFQFFQHIESNHMHKTRTCNRLMQTLSNQITNHQ
jgi:hypothetical protein